jgi:hypothetical protein
MRWTKGCAKAFDAKGALMPRSWNGDNMTEARKTYVSKRSADSRHSIAAAVALMRLHEHQAWANAGTVWQTCAILPHTFVQQKAKVGSAAVTDHGAAATHHGAPRPIFFVLACATYAARVVRAHRRNNTLILLDLRQEWLWLVVIDIMDWEHIRVKHVVSTDNSGQSGFLAAAPIGFPVPAVLPALCAAGFRRLLKDRKDDLIKHCRGETDHGSPCKFPEGMPDLMKHLFADHIDAEY